MKILNLKTNNVFDLPKSEVERLILENPTTFSKGSKKKKSPTPQINSDENSILPLILDV
jgi:hypothetical protein